MSLYQQGLAWTPAATAGVTPATAGVTRATKEPRLPATAGVTPDVGAEGYDAEAIAIQNKANAELQAALKKVANNFPESFHAQKAAEMLEASSIYGRAMAGKWGGVLPSLDIALGTGVDTRALLLAVTIAEDDARKWRNKIPWTGDGYVYRRNQNQEWLQVQSAVLKPYVESAGLVAQRVVVDQAKRELAHDLNPVTAVNLSKIAVIAAVAAAGATFLPGLLNQLQDRVRR